MPPRGRNVHGNPNARNNHNTSSTISSTSRAVIQRGAREVQVSNKSKNREYTSYMERESTKRAVELRSRLFGGGKIVSTKDRIPGREKLDLLAGDLMKTSVRAPFSLNTSINIAQCHMDSYLDDIKDMEDYALCYDFFERELKAYSMPADEKKNMKDSLWVTRRINTCIHNRYLLASAWQIVANELEGLQSLQLPDRITRDQVQKSQAIRSSFSTVYKMVKVVVELQQHRLRSIARHAPHFAPYFKKDIDSDQNDPQIVFNISDELKSAYKSYVDSIALELCLPNSEYPFPVLYQCLSETSKEAPRELKRFPQAMWDAVGDMAGAVKLLEFMEVALMDKEGHVFIDDTFVVPKAFEQWEDAQEVSRRARAALEEHQKFFWPLINLKIMKRLDEMWKCVNDAYKAEGGKDLNALWNVTEARNRPGQWTVYIIPPSTLKDDEDLTSGSAIDGTDRRAITANGELDDDDDDDDPFADMPELLIASDSSDDDFEDSGEEEEDDSDGDGDSESDYDSEDEADYKKMARKAMDFFLSNPDAFDAPEQSEKLAQERKSNPFLKLLGNLRGRMFPASSTLRTRKFDSPSEEELSGVRKPQKGPSGAPNKPTVEEVEDESSPKKDKKKKKKPKKKKKASTAVGDTESVADSLTIAEPVPVSPIPAPAPTPATPPTTPKKSSNANKPKASPASGSTVPPSMYGSTATLVIPQEQSAQSAHSYLREVTSNEPKVKIKSRPDHATTLGSEKKGLLSRFSKSKDDDDTLVEADERQRVNVFSGLKKRTTEYVRKLFGGGQAQEKGSLKWEQFLQIMREMGFKHDPSTAGSSVRFDPPDPKDRSIMFHKPHPDPTLTPILMKKFSKKLRDRYDWIVDDVLF